MMRALTFAPEQIFPVGARHVYPGLVGAVPLFAFSQCFQPSNARHSFLCSAGLQPGILFW
jgi:hypothetical protein